MRKKVLAAVSVMMACASVVPFAACGGDGGGVDAEGNVKKIVMWVGTGEWSGQNLTNLNKFIDAYNAEKPDGFTVDVVPKQDLEKAFQSVLNSRTVPDMMLWDRFNTATNSVNGYLYPVDDLIERDSVDTSAFYAPVMQEMIYDGKTYGLPVDIDVWGTYVNMDCVAECDEGKADSEKIAPRLTAEWTWNDLLDAAKALKSTSALAGYSADDQEQHLFKYYVSTGHGDEYLLPVEGGKKGQYKTNFDNEWTREILTFFKEVKDADVGGKQENESFTSKILAMVNKPLYYNNYIKSNGAGKVENYKFLPQPKPSAEGGVNGGMIGGYSIAYPAPEERFQTQAWHAKHEAAWKFTRWLCTQKENMLKWSKDIGSLPALTAALDADECVEGNQVLADARSYVKATDSQGNYVYMPRPQVPNFLTLQTEVINSQVKLYLSGQLSLDNCIRELTNSGNLQLSMGL